jgi:hypothetical protein
MMNFAHFNISFFSSCLLQLGIDRETEDKVTNKLDQLYQGFKDKYS